MTNLRSVLPGSLACAVAALLIGCFLLIPTQAGAQSPFQQSARPHQVETTRQAPNLWTKTSAYIQFQQQKFYRALAKAIRQLREEQSLAATYSLIALSFLYGIFHAAGPGHGKMVISAYLLANERVVRKGILLAFLSAFVQALSAIFLVGAAVWLLSATGRKTQSFVGTLEQASYALICFVGLYMIWRVIFGHGHAHGSGHDHDDRHDHDHSHDHHHIPTAEQVQNSRNWKEAASIVFAVGIRPCSGAVLVLLFASTVGLISAGIAATFAMALGTAITVAALAILTLFSKQTAMRLFGESSAWATRVYNGLAFVGASAVFLIGAILLWGSLTAPVRPFI